MTAFNDTFLKACRQQPVDHTPVWFMRQAGRYQPEYQKIKEKYSIQEISTIPEVCVEVTLLPVQQFDIDAAIIFSDILIPLGPMGISFEYKAGYGPLIHNPVRSQTDVDSLRTIEVAEELAFTGRALQMLRQELSIPCIGFVGGPFTLVSYMIEGGPSKSYTRLKSLMYNNPATWHKLLDKLATTMGEYLVFQIDNGAMAVQIFDSWIGILDLDDYREYVYPHMQKMIGLVKGRHAEVPLILFGINAAHLNTTFKELGADVVGIDWKTDLMTTWQELNFEVAVQGNLDPTALFAPWEVLATKARRILDAVNGRPGHIFNLGHGILPGTPVENVQCLAEFVKQYTAKS